MIKLFILGIFFTLFTSMASAIHCENGVYKIYISPKGSDSNSGTKDNPLKTLNKVRAFVDWDQPLCEIEVHIEKGDYLGQQVLWTYTNGHRVTFTASEFGGSSDRPRFIGNNSNNTWFTLKSAKGDWSNIHFRYIEISNYWGGIKLLGDRDNFRNGWNGRNEIYGMIFRKIGGKYNPTNNRKGYAAINTFNSRENTIRNNFFINIENDSVCKGCMHAVYLAHYSSNNKVDYNNFNTISGNPVQNRDMSNLNRIEFNTFSKAGVEAQVADWYCNASNCTKKVPHFSADGKIECPSHSLVFANNKYGTLYNGKKQELVWKKSGKDNHCGYLDAKRIRTANNIATF